MRKLILIAIALLLYCSCSEDSKETNEFTEHEESVLTMLRGTFYGEYAMNGGGLVYRTEKITFTPYSEPKKIVSLFGTFNACGDVAIDETYSGINTYSVCYLVISTPVYEGQEQTISFYKYNTTNGEVTNKEDKRTLTIIDNSTIMLRLYGTTEDNNITSNRQ